MTHVNETTVKRILSLKEEVYESAIKQKMEFQALMPNARYEQEIIKYKTHLSYLKKIKEIIKANNKDKEDKIGIAFLPVLKSMDKDKLFTSKVGGVPSCFLGEIIGQITDKSKCFEILQKIYPKSASGVLLRFVGDIDFTLPADFLNLILPPLRQKSKGHSQDIGQLAPSNLYGVDKFSTGSIFVNQNYGRYDCNADGVFKSLRYTWNDDYLSQFSEIELDSYVAVMREFIDTVVNKEESYSIDVYELQEISYWTADVEVINPSYHQGESIGSESRHHPLLKIFGYPRSQQTICPLYCINGMFGPRPMNSFLTLFSQDHDNCVQMFADLLNFNCAQEESTMYIKTDISST